MVKFDYSIFDGILLKHSKLFLSVPVSNAERLIIQLQLTFLCALISQPQAIASEKNAVGHGVQSA